MSAPAHQPALAQQPATSAARAKAHIPFGLIWTTALIGMTAMTRERLD
jgi:hypothetical protein